MHRMLCENNLSKDIVDPNIFFILLSLEKDLSPKQLVTINLSVVEWFRVPFLRQPVIEVVGSTLNSVTLLRPWESCFAVIASAWCILTSSKFLKDYN